MFVEEAAEEKDGTGATKRYHLMLRQCNTYNTNSIKAMNVKPFQEYLCKVTIL